ncbi:MAG: DedA family protein [Rudaea sp.]|nr:DedA family protein [Rudaea sp.]
MRIFKCLYEFALRWAARPDAEFYLAVLSFVEAFIFPIAPEIMLAPMALAKPQRWARYAAISLGGSLLGSFVGYALGHFAFDMLRPALADIGWLPTLDAQVDNLRAAMSENPFKAFWLLVAAGFLPIPLKIATWACGIVGVPMLAFIPGMLIGRGKRVFAVAGAIRFGGAKAEAALHRWIEWIGWGALLLITLVVIYFRFLR